MNPSALLSTLSGLVALVLSIFFYFKSSNVQSLGADLQMKQQEAQEKQQSLQVQQQSFQAQQQQIQAGVQLAQQVGPAVLSDLGALARDNKNEKIRKLLEKYGVTITDKGAGETPKSLNP
jgi:predicted Holliday junction resolvase-like endonuclease